MRSFIRRRLSFVESAPVTRSNTQVSRLYQIRDLERLIAINGLVPKCDIDNIECSRFRKILMKAIAKIQIYSLVIFNLLQIVRQLVL